MFENVELLSDTGSIFVNVSVIFIVVVVLFKCFIFSPLKCAVSFSFLLCSYCTIRFSLLYNDQNFQNQKIICYFESATEIECNDLEATHFWKLTLRSLFLAK